MRGPRKRRESPGGHTGSAGSQVTLRALPNQLPDAAKRQPGQRLPLLLDGLPPGRLAPGTAMRQLRRDLHRSPIGRERHKQQRGPVLFAPLLRAFPLPHRTGYRPRKPMEGEPGSGAPPQSVLRSMRHRQAAASPPHHSVPADPRQHAAKPDPALREASPFRRNPVRGDRADPPRPIRSAGRLVNLATSAPGRHAFRSPKDRS